MYGYQAYHQQQKATPSRIDLVLTLYRTAIDSLERAERLLGEQNPDAVQPLLTKVQLIVSGLGAGMLGDADESANNFRRLYEFVSYKLTQGTRADIVAARSILQTLFEAFEAVRSQAIQLETQGAIPTLDQVHHVSLST